MLKEFVDFVVNPKYSKWYFWVAKAAMVFLLVAAIAAVIQTFF